MAEGLGKIGVLVALESSGDKDRLNALGRQIAMHVAATSPLALNTEELDQAVVEREKAVFFRAGPGIGQAGKTSLKKMVEGRLRKFYEEVTLVKQAFVINPDQTVEQAVEALAKELGTEVKLTGSRPLCPGRGDRKRKSKTLPRRWQQPPGSKLKKKSAGKTGAFFGKIIFL
ncbi:hypothetical protein QW131_10480 [Roseibium salinum]|nr:hypothetical protein [Roseibium salinum]